MAIIAKIKRADGCVCKAIIRKDGRILKAKTFTRKGDATDLEVARTNAPPCGAIVILGRT